MLSVFYPTKVCGDADKRSCRFDSQNMMHLLHRLAPAVHPGGGCDACLTAHMPRCGLWRHNGRVPCPETLAMRRILAAPPPPPPFPAPPACPMECKAMYWDVVPSNAVGSSIWSDGDPITKNVPTVRKGGREKVHADE